MARSLDRTAARGVSPALWAWTAWYAQHRRRQRRSAGAGAADPLMNGLLEYYKPTAGASRMVSVLEKGSVPNTIGAGSAAAVFDASGTYGAGKTVSYVFSATRSGSFLGRGSATADLTAGGATNAFQLTGPAVSGAGCDGFYVVRLDAGSTNPKYRWLAAGSFPYIDISDAGWTAGVPTSVASPRAVVPVLWPRGGDVGTVPTSTSPLGGASYDSGLGGDAAWSVGRADLGVRETVTVAYWICKGASGPQPVSGMRGVYTALRHYATAEVVYNVDFYYDLTGIRGGVWDTGHMNLDWYHVTQTIDNSISAAWLWRVTAKRLRGGQSFIQTGSNDPTGGVLRPLQAGDDIYWDVLSHLFGVGGGVYWNCWGDALFDQIGVWNRVLTLDEVDTLYGAGLGWAPST